MDSVQQAFLLIQEKKQKFLSLSRSVLSSPSTDLKTLQRLSGKCISFSLAVPGARLFLNDIYNVIARSQRHGSCKAILVSGPLKRKLEQWLFLESWSGSLTWLLETHHQVKLCSDASFFAWGCVLGPDTFSATIRDYWPVDQRHLHINVKEAWALANALDAFSGYCVIVGWMFILIARFLSHPGGVKAQSLQTWSSPWSVSLGSFPLVTFTSISFTFPPLLIPRTLLPVFCRCRILSFPLLPGVKFKPDLVTNLVTAVWHWNGWQAPTCKCSSCC